ncbi:hypothetical protein TVAG_191660 [Trichomonas vaginalis G3]|uniref:20 kDa chaperonin, chloroplastic n=1 Tax=Trichomonas vaginalis (strain ATCC PRA-98 / G3) TaxID=412133 RepID=A2EQM2_TRIV3|nr:chaperone cofactor-dependent protein refolding [Trichomonas vaginalis G3]EAY05069.1 hypothetical protein TVAG_191660 [Trichomonas vaginalis G3]KAI5489001.1 chaperone cofactor-dependent protein refolding [Trichomonas vaginalis G3]|eukprot:XP_001317292.1 hypothetical protein [Trichomonas vaginalis G3]
MLALTSRNFAVTAATLFKPLDDRVLVKRVDRPNKTASGIIIPDALKGKHNEATVIAVGPGHREKDGTITPMTLQVGDRVVLADWSGSEVKLDGKEFIVYREDDILAVLE